MITPDKNLVYIENFKLLKSFLNNSTELSKYRTKLSDDKYAVNGILAHNVGGVWCVSLLAPERLSPKTWVLATKPVLREFKGLFGEILTDKNILLPYFLKLSNKIDDNIFINLEAKNFLYKVFSEAGGFREES